MNGDDAPKPHQGFREVFPIDGNSSRLSMVPSITLKTGGTSYTKPYSPVLACSPVESFAKDWFNTMADQIKTNVDPKRNKDGPSGSGRTPDPPRKHRDKRYVDITAMIRSLQRTEGLTDCFRSGLGDCDQLECAWRTYCVGNAKSVYSDDGC